ncbi:hypothetical protein [Rheinheimera sp.]|uniref:hypothetical protein n=1 Tax=Rheinheimera sp. TaxID=1869214 RepID=UPI003AF5B23E
MKINDIALLSFFLMLAFFSYFLGSYIGFYISFSFFLIFFTFKTDKINARFISIFFFMYFSIPFLNISTYRGEVDIQVMGLYALTQFLILLMMTLFEKGRSKPVALYGFVSTGSTELMFWCQMIIIYMMVLYVYSSIGVILIRQDLRFTISPAIEYIIKSGLVLPLIWIFSYNFRPSSIEAIKKLVLPILPSILIGSRGTFIMIVISVMVAMYMFRVFGPSDFVKRYYFIFRKSKRYLIVASVLGVLALYTGFYIRRDGEELITANELLFEYEFISSSLWVKAILPLYIGLRESVGITNRIIMDDIYNPADYPMFFMEMITFLPGHQEAPGIVLARDIYMASGSDEKYSLTPGILGGLYIDYGMLSVLYIVIIASIIIYIFNKGISDLKYRMIYALSIVQFFHLYHRGFLKLEYFVPYFVVFAYMFTLKKVRLT